MEKLLQSAKENLGFLLVCAAVFAGLFLLAWLFERLLVKNRKKFSDTHYIAYTAIFSTMAAVLMLLEIPLFFAPGFYKLDLSELPVMICTFYLGPVAGVVSEFIKVFLKLIFKGTSTAFVGDFANFAVGCTFVLPGHDRLRQRLQRPLSHPQVRPAFPHGTGKDRGHGNGGERPYHQRLYPGALCGGTL